MEESHPCSSPHLGKSLFHLVHVQPLAYHLSLHQCHPEFLIRIANINITNITNISAILNSNPTSPISDLFIDPLHRESLTCGRSVFNSRAFAAEEKGIHLVFRKTFKDEESRLKHL